MNWPNGQAMADLETLRERLTATRQLEAKAWADGRVQDAMRLNTQAAGCRTAIEAQVKHVGLEQIAEAGRKQANELMADSHTAKDPATQRDLFWQAMAAGDDAMAAEIAAVGF